MDEMLDCWFACHLDMNKHYIIRISEIVILITVHSNISDIFQQHFSNFRVTAALNLYLVMFYSRCNKPSFTIMLRKYVID